jgi:hypothetical protein
MNKMTKELADQLAAAGYTEAQIAKEAKYLARVALENAHIREDRAWGYGFHRA